MSSTPSFNRSVNQAYADYLQSHNWNGFYTVTCRTPRKDNIALIRDIKNVIDGTVVDPYWGGYVDPNYKSFIAIEPHRFTGAIHAHGLISWNDPDIVGMRSVGRNKGLCGGLAREFRHFFGYSRVSPVNTNSAVSLYCAKYVTKRNGEYDYEFLGNWSSST